MDGRQHLWYITLASLLPFAAVIGGAALLWNKVFSWSDLIVFLIMNVITGLGVSLGYHRMLTHRAFTAVRPLRFALIASGAMAGQGPPLIWAAHHRRHHRVADKPSDPHSPYTTSGSGARGVLDGLWHAHLGWLFNTELTSDPVRYCPDLCREADVRNLSKHFYLVVAAGVVLPGLLGYAIGGTVMTALTGALWGGPIRMFIGNHITYSINSLGHYMGRRRFDTADESRNVAWLSVVSFGESWHNNHHAFPRSARHGFAWWELDLSAMTLRVFEALHLASNVIRLDPAVIERRAAALSAASKSKSGRFAESSPSAPLAERGRGSVRDFALVSEVDVE